MKAHKYVRLIEFAMDTPKFSRAAACKACSLSDKEFCFIAESVFVLNAVQGDATHPMPADEVDEWVLSPAAYFGHFQFVAYRRAIRVAVIALVVSIVSAAAQFAALIIRCS